MCKYCDNIPNKREDLQQPYTIYYNPAIQDFMITARPYYTGRYLSHEHDQFIKYCPWCGHKLEEDK